jgi:hypothetical protein
MKGLRDPSLIHKLAMKNPRSSEVMFSIAKKYALTEEAALDVREQKKEKESGHMDRSVNVVEQPRQAEESGLFYQCGGTAETQQGVPAQAG